MGAASPSPVGEGSRGKEGTGGDGHLRAIDSAEESTDTEETVGQGPAAFPRLPALPKSGPGGLC